MSYRTAPSTGSIAAVPDPALAQGVGDPAPQLLDTLSKRRQLARWCRTRDLSDVVALSDRQTLRDLLLAA